MMSMEMHGECIDVEVDDYVLEIVTHEELLRLGGKYATMYDTWAKQGGMEFDQR